jgi:hypothetical protein
MNVEKKYQSEISMIVHQDAEGMYQLGIIDDVRMREFDEMCLVQEPEPAKETVETTKKGADRGCAVLTKPPSMINSVSNVFPYDRTSGFD